MSTTTDSRRRLAVIMFTDMVGYSALTQKNEALALELLEEHRQILQRQFAEYGGDAIKNTGDGFLVAFESALQAVICATEIQKAMMMRNKNAAADRKVYIRLGLHAGDIVVQGNDVIRLESVGKNSTWYRLSPGTNGSLRMTPSSSGEDSDWEMVNLQSDPSKPRLLMASMKSKKTGGWLSAGDNGSIRLEQEPEPLASQWIIHLDPSYEKTGAVSIRRRPADGSSNTFWLEADPAAGTVYVSKGSAPGAKGLWRIQKVR